MDQEERNDKVGDFEESLHLPPCLRLQQELKKSYSHSSLGSPRRTPPICLAQQSVHVREVAKHLSKMQLKWNESDSGWPTRFMIVHREGDEITSSGNNTLFGSLWPLIIFLLNETPAKDQTLVYLNSNLKTELPITFINDSKESYDRIHFWSEKTEDEASIDSNNIDLLISIGGDGTILSAAWLFQKIVPPIVPFHHGTVGFLNLFNISSYVEVISKLIVDGCRVNLRMRLHVELNFTQKFETYEIMNEVVVDRGASPYMTQLDLFADGHFITTVQADGLIIATPTGSTAYSMSAGGSVVHPEVPAMLVTPICSHTLSLRPFMLPDSIELTLCLNPSSRGSAWASFDGRCRVEMKKGDRINIACSKYPVPTVCRDDQTRDWFRGLAKCLHWNDRPTPDHL